ncbi:hypothetical protein HDU84_008122 [Entophlyctis sp. JEL0112]|nr:hypothetical protein HDU84_008122 [Entophlyctis sp. JEL0112]
MKVNLSLRAALALLLCLALAVPVLAWDKEDYAIFDLHDKLVKIKGDKDAHGKKISFYSILGVTPSATPIQLSRAYRQLSLELHPDKNPEPSAAQLYALLTSINGILKDKDSRERYDGHLKRGIPVWRGTGYFIARYKPSLAFILIFCALAISAGQYVAQYVQYSQAKKKLEAHLTDLSATGSNDNLGYVNLRRMLKTAGLEEPPAVTKAIKNGVAVAQILKMPELADAFSEDDRRAELNFEANQSRKALDDALKPDVKKTILVQLPLFFWNFRTHFEHFRKGFGEAVEIAKKEAKKKQSSKSRSKSASVTAAKSDNEDPELDGKPKRQSVAKLMKEARLNPKEFEKKMELAKKQKAAEEGDEAAKAELAELEADAAAAAGTRRTSPRKKTAGKDMLRSKNGVVMSKADFIKMAKEEMAKAKLE